MTAIKELSSSPVLFRKISFLVVYVIASIPLISFLGKIAGPRCFRSHCSMAKSMPFSSFSFSLSQAWFSIAAFTTPIVALVWIFSLPPLEMLYSISESPFKIATLVFGSNS